MSYVLKTLIPNESVLYDAKITRLTYLPGILMVLIGLFIKQAASELTDETQAFIGSGLIFFGVLKFLDAILDRWTTELAVTSKRVIHKVGFVSRKTSELNHLKVESIHVDQGILGRLFNYGTITVIGTGGGRTPIPNIDSPLDFRRKAMETIDSNQYR